MFMKCSFYYIRRYRHIAIQEINMFKMHKAGYYQSFVLLTQCISSKRKHNT